MTLCPWLGASGIIIHWHIRSPLHIYKCSFFPQTISDWNAFPDSLYSSAEGAEDRVAKFTSLVRAREIHLVRARD